MLHWNFPSYAALIGNLIKTAGYFKINSNLHLSIWGIFIHFQQHFIIHSGASLKNPAIRKLIQFVQICKKKITTYQHDG